MVWGLFPIDSLRGAQKYYIFSQGTYKVGRKDCDIVVQTDTAVSRLHAEIVVNKMISCDPSQSGPASSSSYVRIIDRSKYGTLINKELGTKSVRVNKDKDATLKDGDTVTFGTGNATFRFTFVPLMFFIHCSRSNHVNRALQATIASIGAYATYHWIPECTHVIVDESSPVTLDLIEAVVAEKPFVLSDWLKVLAEKNICTEFPCFTSYAPTLCLEGKLVKIVEPKVRDKCLGGYTFLLATSDKYKFKEKFQLFLRVVGATFLDADEFCSSSQISADDGSNPYVLVVPEESPNEFGHLHQLSSLSRVTEMKLVFAMLSGRLESSFLEPPSILVTSSRSTDETIVADSDVEIDTATSDRVSSGVKCLDAMQYEYEEKDVDSYKQGDDARKYESKDKTHTSDFSNARDGDVCTMKRIEKSARCTTDEHEHSDIIYSQDLVVRDLTESLPARSTPKNVINFKCFRKRKTVSGNSFKDLVPFSKDPYKESDYGNDKTAEYMREEKKRRQMEAIAEDLFNNEKARKRATAGTSLQAFLARR